MTLIVGTIVVSSEHPKAVGTVTLLNKLGMFLIEWVTPPSELLPFGHTIFEFWPVADAPRLQLWSNTNLHQLKG